jgi:hypothetical protein
MAAKPRPGYGYLEFLFDGGRFDQPRFSGTNGRLALRMAVNGYYSPAYLPRITYAHIPHGQHSLLVRLANLDGSLTGVSTSVRFVVR